MNDTLSPFFWEYGEVVRICSVLFVARDLFLVGGGLLFHYLVCSKGIEKSTL